MALGLATLVMLAGSACARLAPAGFWASYRPELIENKSSDQGPWGGARWIQWASDKPGTFVEGDVKEWATDNGWTYCDRTEYPAQVVATEWRFSDGRRVFPLLDRHPELLPTGGSSSFGVQFPRHMAGDLIVLRFDTAWMREDPGTNEMTPAYGYVVLGEEGRKLAVYHFWGNG